LLFSLVLIVLFGGAQGHGKPKKSASAKIAFSHEHGFYEEPFSLALTSSLPAAAICYTTNGSAPSTSSQHYEKPVRIDTTTVLRAATVKDGEIAGPIETRSYIFPRQVLKQTGAGFPQTWGIKHGVPVAADYEMDPEIVNHPDYKGALENALKSIPTMSVVMEPLDLFDPRRGIYANAEETGADAERAAAVELIYPEGSDGFAANCGIRIQGGWNRRPEESPKHAFRLLFKKKYGSGKLEFPLFGDAGVKEFETIVLRSGNNNSWLHWSGEERRRADFIRDQWMRDTLRAMGHPSPRGFFAHLYLNGLYWGLYNICERPSAPFVAANLGGSAADYDSRNADKVLEGDDLAWKKMFALANGGLQGAQEFGAIKEMLDLPAFVDFMIANFYGANADWDRSSNWYAARRRSPPGKFQFFVWDGERTLEKVDDNTISFDDDESPARLFQKLRANPEFRREFGEHVKRHLSNGGCLTPEPAAERFRRWSTNIDQAVIAESARWGDYRRDVHRYKTEPYELYTRNEHWRPEVKRLLGEYFPQRTAVAVKQFREAGLYSPAD